MKIENCKFSLADGARTFLSASFSRFLPCIARTGMSALLAACSLQAATVPHEIGGSTPLQWSVRMADSEMARRGDSLAWKEGGKAKWDYTAGLFTLSLLRLRE